MTERNLLPDTDRGLAATLRKRTPYLVALLASFALVAGIAPSGGTLSPTEAHAAKRTSKKVTSQDIRVAHFSTNVFNSRKKQSADMRKVLKRGYAWVTFTELGKDRKQMKKIAKRNGYRAYAPEGTDGGIAVKKSLISGGWKTGKDQVIRYSSKRMGSSRLFGPKAVAWVSFKNKKLGRISVSTGHFLTKGRVPGRESIHGRANHYTLNKRYANAIGAWARKHGKGGKIAFYGGDQNIPNDLLDPLLGAPLTTTWDALRRYPKTQPAAGTIDVIASYTRDKRVKTISSRSLNDKQFRLHSDHYLVDAVYRIKVPKSAR